jgi:hypothetical protein
MLSRTRGCGAAIIKSRLASSALRICGILVGSLMKDLGRQIVPTHRHLQQKAQAGHRAVAVLERQAALDQMQLEQADIIGGGRVGRPLQIGREPLAGAHVTLLRLQNKAARTMSSIMRWRSGLIARLVVAGTMVGIVVVAVMENS